MKPQEKAWAQEEQEVEQAAKSKCADQQSKKLNSSGKPADRGMCEKESAVQGSEVGQLASANREA
jgi:hypothetical protein